MAITRLGNTVRKKYRDIVRKDLYSLEKKQRYTKAGKIKTIKKLINLANVLDKKETHKYSDYDNLDYFGIKDIINLFDDIDDDDYYEPILVKSPFNNKYEQYEIRGDKNKTLSMKEYLYMIMPQLADLINKKKNNRNEQKIQLIIGINFININDKNKAHTFYVRSDNEEIRLGNDTYNIITKINESLLNNYQKQEQILRNGSDCVFESVKALNIHIHKTGLKRGSSYIKSPKWIRNKEATINPKNTNDNKCFQYAIIAALHHDDIKKDPQRISKLKPFISNYNWKDINFPAGISEWQKFERNNKDAALNILSASHIENVNIMYKSDYNRKREKQVVLLMITDNDQEDTKDNKHKS